MGPVTFNISTTAAFIVAAAGIPVAKHGNGPSPAAAGAPRDALEALGVYLGLIFALEQGRSLSAEAGIGFLFAPFSTRR